MSLIGSWKKKPYSKHIVDKQYLTLMESQFIQVFLCILIVKKTIIEARTTKQFGLKNDQLQLIMLDEVSIKTK
jgi:hypothetical protein